MTSTETRARHTVPAASAGERLDRFLAGALAPLSRARVQRLIRDGHVTRGGETLADPSYRVKPDEEFAIVIPAATEPTMEPQLIDLTVVYEDADLLVIDKPAGLVVHPGPGRPDETLVNALLAHCGDSLSGVGGVRRPGIVHRLDKDTSGLIVAAKNDETHHGLANQFAARSIDRVYRAFVWGVPSPPQGEIEGNIGRHPRQRKKMAVVGEGRGKHALTRYRVEQRFGQVASLVECRLATGRTHQIRVHLSHIGHPLIGDPVYGRAPAGRLRQFDPETAAFIRDFGRQALHAALIGFDHPRLGRRLKFTSCLPSEMKLLKRRLTA
jgi:23S rRNA pseudouridine1911/1915/1917 synthase